MRIETETDQDGETETRDSIKGLGDGNRTRVSILQAAHIHLNSDMMLHTSARYRRESTSLPTHNNTTTCLITDRQHGQNTAHTQTHTQPNMTGKEKDRKQKVQKKKSEQSLKPILGGKEEDFWGASTYWIILEIRKTIWQHTLPSWP